MSSAEKDYREWFSTKKLILLIGSAEWRLVDKSHINSENEFDLPIQEIPHTDNGKRFRCECGHLKNAKRRDLTCHLCFSKVFLRDVGSVCWMNRAIGLIFAALSIFHYIGASTEINNRKSELALQNYPKLHKAAIWIKKFCENNYLYGLRPRRKEFYAASSTERLSC